MELSLAEARRLAVSSQSFGPRPPKAAISHVRKLASKIHYFQIDSINVLARAHYIPAFSRLGSYPAGIIDTLTYKHRQLFEVWGHAACLMPVDMYPLFHYRTELWKASSPWRPGTDAPDSKYIENVYKEVVDRGPMTARDLAEPGKRRGKWWGWNHGKIALEHLFRCGRLGIAGRRGFEREYDIIDRVLPNEVLKGPFPSADESRKQLICLAADALGVATANALTWHFGIHQDSRHTKEKRLGPRLVSELVEEGHLQEATVEGWKHKAYTSPGPRVPRQVKVRALLGPFDNLMKGNLPAMCGFSQNLAQQLYVPEEKRLFGYYVLPFLLDDELVGRCDLKADRQRSVLMVRGAFAEPGQDTRRVGAELAAELREMQEWLQLDAIEVADRGDLAKGLKRLLR